MRGAPRTTTLSVHSPLKTDKVNLGVILINDRIGTRNETGIVMNYAYRIDMGKGKLSFGLAAGLSNIYTNRDLIRYNDPGDNLLTDPGVNAVLPEFGFGVYYYTPKYYAGFSVPMFLDHSFSPGTGKYSIAFNPGNMNYMFTTGYIFTLSDKFELFPSFLFKTSPMNSTQLDINCNIIYDSKIWFGTGFRSSSNLGFLFQYQVNDQLRVSYSYGHEFSELSTVQRGTHEIVLQYSFRYLLDVISPRYF